MISAGWFHLFKIYLLVHQFDRLAALLYICCTSWRGPRVWGASAAPLGGDQGCGAHLLHLWEGTKGVGSISCTSGRGSRVWGASAAPLGGIKVWGASPAPLWGDQGCGEHLFHVWEGTNGVGSISCTSGSWPRVWGASPAALIGDQGCGEHLLHLWDEMFPPKAREMFPTPLGSIYILDVCAIFYSMKQRGNSNVQVTYKGLPSHLLHLNILYWLSLDFNILFSVLRMGAYNSCDI